MLQEWLRCPLEKRKWKKLPNSFLWGNLDEDLNKQITNSLSFSKYPPPNPPSSRQLYSRHWKKCWSSENNNNQDIIIPGLALRCPGLERWKRGVKEEWERVGRVVKARQKHFQKTWVTCAHAHQQSSEKGMCQKTMRVKKGKDRVNYRLLFIICGKKAKR